MHAIVSDSLSEEKGGLIMTLAEQLEKNGIQKGLEQGLAQGLAKGIEQGIEQGIAKGRKEGREEGLLEGIEVAVTVKFGDSNEFNTIIAKIKNIQDVNLLRALKDKIISAGTVSELMQFIDN
jgi:flagellar biosynthesis/type III secretory pathway protein FliH